MSYQAMAWAIEQDVESPSARCVLMSIANYANEDWCAEICSRADSRC